jgi:hypothetical protein
LEIEASKSDANKTYEAHDTDSTQSSLKRLLDLSSTTKGASKAPARKSKAKRVRNKKSRDDNKPD